MALLKKGVFKKFHEIEFGFRDLKINLTFFRKLSRFERRYREALMFSSQEIDLSSLSVKND